MLVDEFGAPSDEGSSHLQDLKEEPRLKVLVIGNFLSESRGTRSVCEDLSVALAAAKWSVLTTSSKQNRVARIIDILLTTIRRRKQYEVAHVDVHSGFGVVLADLICFVLRKINKPYVLTLRGGNLPGVSPSLINGCQRIIQKASVVTAPLLVS